MMGLPLPPAAGYRWSKSDDAACGEYVTALKVTDKATDAPQTARAGKKIDRVGTGFASLDDGVTTPSPRRRRRDTVNDKVT